ncbi:hypothetical protein ACFVOO_16140 [Streptomyces rochei]|uniref:hypothetical protein n=1 Tax=Streptomyces rochei TaxID=1928 RepID=UPI0036BA63A5
MADEFRQLVRTRRKELRLSYQSLATACTEAGARVSSGWLHRLERGATVDAPGADVLAALATGLRLELTQVQDAAAAEFFGLRRPWEASGEAADVLAALARLPEDQRQSLLDLIRVLAASQPGGEARQ